MLLLFMSTIYVIVLANVLDASMGLTSVEAREPLYQGGGYFGGALWSFQMCRCSCSLCVVWSFVRRVCAVQKWITNFSHAHIWRPRRAHSIARCDK